MSVYIYIYIYIYFSMCVYTSASRASVHAAMVGAGRPS